MATKGTEEAAPEGTIEVKDSRTGQTYKLPINDGAIAVLVCDGLGAQEAVHRALVVLAEVVLLQALHDLSLLTIGPPDARAACEHATARASGGK